MKIYPAIDIIDGRCVRLRQGSFDDVTVYRDDPAEVAEEFMKQGAEYIHVVDLDGAKKGHDVSAPIIRRIVESTGLPVQTGGGIRSLEDIRFKLSTGIARVIIGTMAVKEPQFVKDAIKAFGAERIVVGLDGRGGIAAINGWEQQSTADIISLACSFADMGVKTIVYTDISRDGMLIGPDVEYTARLVKETGIDIIASGGIGSPDDLAQLDTIGVEGAITGKAIYEGKINLREEILKRK